jgi:hypothetical protein
MNFFYIVAIISTVIFLVTSIIVARTLKEKIANGFESEDENDLRWHVIALSVGSFVLLLLLALLYAIFYYLVGGAEHPFLMFVTASMIGYPIATLIIAFGLPIQTLGVVYSFVYFKSSEKKVKPTIYLALALASSLGVIALIVQCVRVFAFWCL